MLHMKSGLNFCARFKAPFYISIFCCLDSHEDAQGNFAKSECMFKQTRFNLTEDDFDAAKKLDGKYILCN